jgi:hypothetical protein
MQFSLINQELTEAKIFHVTHQFGMCNGRDIADLLYLNTLFLIMLRDVSGMKEWAERYAGKTRQAGTYALFRTYATDLYLLAYQVLHPHNDYAKMREPDNSKGFLQNLNFDGKRHIQIMNRVSVDNLDIAEAYVYLLRLEQQLKIQDNFFKAGRRMLVSWEDMPDDRKIAFLKRIYNYAIKIGNGTARNTEIFIEIKRAITGDSTARRRAHEHQ